MSLLKKIPEPVQKFFDELHPDTAKLYGNYWDSITPQENTAYFRRWLFAYLSVHTTWKSNVLGYLELRNCHCWLGKADLEQALQKSRTGRYRTLPKFLLNFHNLFWEDPERFKPGSSRPYVRKQLDGLGLAKTAFALEMLQPRQEQVVCMDTHMLRLFGLNTDSKERNIMKAEEAWIEMSLDKGIPPFITRNIFWDKKQNKPSCRFWSFVFEWENTIVALLPRLLSEGNQFAPAFDAPLEELEQVRAHLPKQALTFIETN